MKQIKPDGTVTPFTDDVKVMTEKLYKAKIPMEIRSDGIVLIKDEDEVKAKQVLKVV